MSNRNRNRNRNNQPVASAADASIETVADEATVIDTSSDDAIEAALAAIQAETDEAKEIVAMVTEPVEVVDLGIEAILAVTEPVEDTDPEIEAILAEHAEPVGVVQVEGAEEAPEIIEPTEPAVVEAVSEEDVQDVIENDADALLAELEADDNGDPTATTAPKKAARQKKAAATPAPSVPQRDFYSVASIDKATMDARLNACNAKKVIEKATNLIQAVEAGKRLSRYTSVAVKTLVSEGRVSGKKLVETFEAEGLSTGTARAQAQQMTALFKMTGVAAPDATAPRELVIADQTLADELMKLAA
jgi:hypothetical protein